MAAVPPMPAVTIPVTDQPSVGPLPLASVVSVPRDRWVTLTRLAASLREVVPAETETVLTRVFVSVADVRTSAMTPVDPTPSAASRTDRPSASVFRALSPVLWMPARVSVTVSCVEQTQTVWEAARVKLARVGSRVEVRQTVWWGSSALRACV